MNGPYVEFVTLSDSLTSPDPKPKCKSRNADQGTVKVVCLDSDTESDGSCVQTVVSKVAFRASNDVLPDECKKSSDSWLGLHKCSNYSKPWKGSQSLSSDKALEIDIHGAFNAIIQSDQTLNSSLDAKPKRSTWGVDCTNDSHSVSDFFDKPGVDHVDLQPGKGSADIALCSINSPVEKTGNSFSYDNTMVSAALHTVGGTLSPLTGVQAVESSPSKNSADCSSPAALHAVGGTLSPLTGVQAVESSPSKNSADCCSPAWDDHLKEILYKLETSKGVMRADFHLKHIHKQDQKREYIDYDSEDYNYHGDYSFLRNKLRKCDAGFTTVTEHNSCTHVERHTEACSNESDRQSPKATKKTIGVSTSIVMDIDDSANALDRETEKLRKKEKQTKDREERDARKQQLKLERETLRKERQDEKKRQQELKKQRNEEEKKRKEELKAEAVGRRKVEKEKEKWEKGKFALQNIAALVDIQILEAGLIGGHLLTRFAEKGFKYHLVKNPVKKTVIWQMKLPSKESQLDLQEDCLSQDSQEPKALKKVRPQLSLENVDVSYVLIVLEADEFLEMIAEGTLDKHIRNLQKIYPGFTLCYLINKLMWFLHKREQKQYKTPGDNWCRPPVEQILAKLATCYDGVHSRLCVDEAEVSDHIVGLTRSLAECPFKRKLTPLSLSANGDHVVKNDPNNDIIKKDVWLKALVALPKVSGSCAIAIAKKYPSMSALFEAYLDPDKTVHEKEHLLQDLVKEGLLGGDNNRRIGPVCSKRVFRILMAVQGNLHTDDVEEGADAFRD